MNNIKKAIQCVLKDSTELDSICSVLINAAKRDTINYDAVQTAAGPSTGEVLLEMWEWKLLLPIRSSKCGEWDFRGEDRSCLRAPWARGKDRCNDRCIEGRRYYKPQIDGHGSKQNAVSFTAV